MCMRTVPKYNDTGVLVSDMSGGMRLFDVRRSSCTLDPTTAAFRSKSRWTSNGNINSSSSNTQTAGIVREYVQPNCNRLLNYRPKFSVFASERLAAIPGFDDMQSQAACVHVIDLSKNGIMRSISLSDQNRLSNVQRCILAQHHTADYSMHPSIPDMWGYCLQRDANCSASSQDTQSTVACSRFIKLGL